MSQSWIGQKFWKDPGESAIDILLRCNSHLDCVNDGDIILAAININHNVLSLAMALTLKQVEEKRSRICKRA